MSKINFGCEQECGKGCFCLPNEHPALRDHCKSLVIPEKAGASADGTSIQRGSAKRTATILAGFLPYPTVLQWSPSTASCIVSYPLRFAKGIPFGV